mgnify:CR=1 FL=1
MLGANYPTKSDLKKSVGQHLDYIETSMFGPEFKTDGKFCVVGPNPYNARNWFAEVTMEQGLIAKVK